MDLNSKFLATAGTISYSTDYDSLTSLISAINASNHSVIEGQLNSLNFTEVGEYQNFQEELSIDDEQEIISSKCGSGTVEVSRFKNVTVRRDRWELDDVELIAKMMGLDVVTTSAGSQAITDQVLNFTSADKGIELIANADGSKPTITTVNDAVLAGGTPSVEGTDYEVKQVGNKWYIFIIDGGNMSVGTNYYLTGSYTVLTKKTTGFNIERASVPFMALKFVSCDQELTASEKTLYNANYVRRTSYFVKMVPNANIIRAFQDRDLGELATQSVEMVGKKGGLYFNVKEYVA